jgi:hypothetical protein
MSPPPLPVIAPPVLRRQEPVTELTLLALSQSQKHFNEGFSTVGERHRRIWMRASYLTTGGHMGFAQKKRRSVRGLAQIQLEALRRPTSSAALLRAFEETEGAGELTDEWCTAEISPGVKNAAIPKLRFVTTFVNGSGSDGGRAASS